MRKVVVAEFLSLDGVMEEPSWSMPYWGDDIAKFKLDELFASDAHLLGRVTYQGFAEAWPSRTDEAGFSDRMNNLPKYVVTTTLEKGEWDNSHLIKENVAEEVSKIKQQPGQDILVAGSATLVQTLIQHNLVDEYHLLVYPVVLGTGKRLFQDGSKTTLKLVESKPFSSGVVLLVYQTVKSAKVTVKK
ncbi:MAG: dihydrofolate reductase family protein [Chloroflexota bacterium]